MLNNAQFVLNDNLFPDMLLEIRSGNMKGRVIKKLPDDEKGFIEPSLNLFYPNGQSVGSIYSDELANFDVDDCVLFKLDESSATEKVKKKQPHLKVACNVEYDTDPDTNIRFEVYPLDEMLKAAEKDILAKTKEQVAERSLELDRKEEILNEKENELNLKIKHYESQIAELVAERVAASKSDFDLREEQIKQRENDLEREKQSIENLRQTLASDYQTLRRVFPNFKSGDLNELIKIFDLSAIDIKKDVSTLHDLKLPRKLPEAVYQFLDEHRCSINQPVCTQFLLSAFSATITGQFVVLSGPTGVGKTSMVNMFASALGIGHGVVPVRPAWIDPTDLLGFYNPQKNRYQASPFMDRLIDAQQYSKANRMYFLTLDEMNLSRVENYAADFLSRLEKSREGEDDADLSLYSKDIETQIKLEFGRDKDVSEQELKSLSFAINHLSKYPSSIKIPDGLVLFGTINLDETTHNLSPKFLDRSFVINIPPHELVTNIADWNGGNAKIPTYFDLSLSMVKSMVENQGELPNDAQKIWNNILLWQEKYISPLGIRLGFRFSKMYVTYMSIADKLNVHPRAAASAFLKSKLFPWISFHRDDTAIGNARQAKLDILQAWAEDESLSNYPEEYGLQNALQRILERSSDSVVIQYLE